MNNIQANFGQILEFARAQGVPVSRQRNILREYLQTRLVAEFYSSPQADQLILVGGTGLRLLRNLDRFSEDLDFDNLGLSDLEIGSLVGEGVNRLRSENIEVELVVKSLESRSNYEMRFVKLPFELGITTNPKEKLKIKFNYSNLWKGQNPESMLLNKYGMLETVLANPLNQIIVQKLTAYVRRPVTQPRDLYDVVWLYAQGGRLDRKFMAINGVDNILDEAKVKFSKDGIPPSYPNRLRPFLFDEQKVRWLSLFQTILQNL